MKNFAKSKRKHITVALLCAVMCIMSLIGGEPDEGDEQPEKRQKSMNGEWSPVAIGYHI